MKQYATPDSSFWINAYRSGLLPYVLDRYQLQCAPAVAAELREAYPSGREFWNLFREGLFREAVPQRDEVKGFGPGERAAMNLALEHDDRILLIDDRRPFMEAMRLGLRVLCTPVLTVELFAEGALDARGALHIFGRLAVIQTVSPSLIAAALAQMGRSLTGRGG